MKLILNTLERQPDEDALRESFAKFILQHNILMQSINTGRPGYSLGVGEWPTELRFYPDVFDTLEEAKSFGAANAGETWVAVCKSKKNRLQVDEMTWVLVSLATDLPVEV